MRAVLVRAALRGSGLVLPADNLLARAAAHPTQLLAHRQRRQ